MNISIVGAGNVATHLTLHLHRAGHTIRSIYSRSGTTASVLADKLVSDGVGEGSSEFVRPLATAYPSSCTTSDDRPLTTDSLASLAPADVYIISVRDDALPEVISHWPEHCRSGIVLHTAGSLDAALLAPVAPHYGVLYPMQTFSKDKAVDFSQVTCFIEGNDSTSLTALHQLASSLTPHVVELSSERRRWLHLAAVFACNFSNHMYHLAYGILERSDIDPTCLLPLIEETTAKLHHLHPRDGQTGPAQRGDTAVMASHHTLLDYDPALQHLYDAISQSIRST